MTNAAAFFNVIFISVGICIGGGVWSRDILHLQGQRLLSSAVPGQCDCRSQSVARGEPVPIFVNVFIFISFECHSWQPFF